MAGYAVVNDATQMVDNTVIWDGASEWAPPEGTTAVEITEATGSTGPGFTWDGTKFIAPPIPPDDREVPAAKPA